jgi:hypothetical protein
VIVVVVVKDINWDMNSFLYRRYVYHTHQVVHYKWRGCRFKTRFKAKYFSKALRWLSTFWYCIRCCRYCESSWEMTLSINFLLVSLPSTIKSWSAGRNDYKGIKPTWSENALPLRFNTFDLSSNYRHLFVSLIFYKFGINKKTLHRV